MLLPITKLITVTVCRQARKLQDMVDRLQGAGAHRQLPSAGGRSLQQNNRNLGSGFGSADDGHHVVLVHRKHSSLANLANCSRVNDVGKHLDRSVMHTCMHASWIT
jgi:hypothetical protein